MLPPMCVRLVACAAPGRSVAPPNCQAMRHISGAAALALGHRRSTAQAGRGLKDQPASEQAGTSAAVALRRDVRPDATAGIGAKAAQDRGHAGEPLRRRA